MNNFLNKVREVSYVTLCNYIAVGIPLRHFVVFLAIIFGAMCAYHAF